jgi:hypothetical protein
MVLSQIKLSRVIANESASWRRSEESVSFKISQFDKQISLGRSADQNELHLLMNSNNLTK